MSLKLTDTQIVMLSDAAQRDDRCLVAPRNLKVGTAQKSRRTLLTVALRRRSRRSPELRCGGKTSKPAYPLR